jgi:hypothetical protein
MYALPQYRLSTERQHAGLVDAKQVSVDTGILTGPKSISAAACGYTNFLPIHAVKDDWDQRLQAGGSSKPGATTVTACSVSRPYEPTDV